MRGRYFLLAGATDEARAIIHDRAGKQPVMRVVFDVPGLIVLAEPDATVIPLGHAGLILGVLHTQGRRERLSSLRPDMATLIAHGRGEQLARAYWGNYVAILRDSASGDVDLLRSPLGALPCLFTGTSRGIAAGSDVALLERFGDYRPSIDWDAIARFAAAPDVRLAETCLAHVREVQGGTRLTIGTRAPDLATVWSPWTFAQPEKALLDREEAARRLRDSIVAAVGSAASDHGRTTILLSGGLDSSIVAASAAAAGADATCVTVSTRAASGDERDFARQAAGRVGLPLMERSFDLAGVDLLASDAALCPRPVARAFEVEGRRQARLAAQAGGAIALFSGGGGDNIFCSLQSVAAAVDCLDSPDGRREFWRVARDLSQLTGASVMTIARKAWWRSRQRNRQYSRPFEPNFLSAGAIAIAQSAPLHPWLDRRPPVLQGKGAHVAAMLGVQSLTEDTDPLDPFGLIYPLLAQPVVELCLRIPIWFWYDRGCNRAAARHAYSADLPPAIAWRRSKGTPDSFVVEIFEARRDQIRKMLADGNLAQQGLLDLSVLLPILDDRSPVRGSNHGRIMRLLDIEAWTRCWVE